MCFLFVRVASSFLPMRLLVESYLPCIPYGLEVFLCWKVSR